MNRQDANDPEQPQIRVLGRGRELESTILAIDPGEARIGLAIKPAGQTVALPVKILPARPAEVARATIHSIITERAVNLVLVGLPLHDDPTQARRVKRFSRWLRQGVAGVRWRFVDETLSSQAAAELARDVATRRREGALDDRAAALILETYLQAPR